MTRNKLFASMCILGLFSANVSAESIDDVKKKIHDKLSSYKTMQFKTKTTTDMTNEQFSMKSDSTSNIEAAKKGDKVLSRMEMTTKGETKFSGQSQKTDSNMVVVCDGDYIYTYSDAQGMKSATKQKVDKNNFTNFFDHMNSWKQMEQTHTFKLAPDETVDGKPCWVIESNMKNAPAGMPAQGKSLSYYDKSTGISLKSVAYDDKGKVTTTSTTTDIKLDGSIPPDKFVFKAPAGVEVVDQAELMKRGG